VRCKLFSPGRDRCNGSPYDLVAGVLFDRNPPRHTRQLAPIIQSRRFSLLKALAIAIIPFCGSSGSGHAAPFCLQIYGQPPQCIFVDSRECYRAAIRQQANCTYNPAEVSLPKSAPQRFCMVFTGPIFDCAFTDRRSCGAQAPSRGGICIDLTPGQPDVDLFRR
jgi:hypothetical protein